MGFAFAVLHAIHAAKKVGEITHIIVMVLFDLDQRFYTSRFLHFMRSYNDMEKKEMMKKTASVLALLGLGLLTVQASAQQSPWQVRMRAVQIDTANKSDPVGGVGASNRVHVSNKTIAEVDISYFFTPNIAAELILTNPQKHNVYLDGAKIGTFKHLPPTLTLQYHFTPQAVLRPYVGAGINYTRISKVNLLNGGLTLENDSVGYALQGGVDYMLDKTWSINLDVKKLRIRSDLFAGGVQVSQVKVDPLLIGIGVGYRF